MIKASVKQPNAPEAEVPVEVLATAIVSVADAVTRLRNGRLNDRALFLLIQHSSSEPLTIKQIKAVFDASASLKKQFLKPATQEARK